MEIGCNRHTSTHTTKAWNRLQNIDKTIEFYGHIAKYTHIKPSYFISIMIFHYDISDDFNWFYFNSTERQIAFYTDQMESTKRYIRNTKSRQVIKSNNNIKVIKFVIEIGTRISDDARCFFPLLNLCRLCVFVLLAFVNTFYPY